MLAQSTISSQKELLPSRIKDVQRKIEITEQKMEDYQTGKKTPKKVSLEICLKGLNARLVKLQKKKSEIVTIQEEGSIPTVIFGGKKNFYNRMKNKITKKEWKDLRTNKLYSRGDQSKKGNLNMRIVCDEKDNEFYLEVANPLLKEPNKAHSPRMRFKLRIPDKYFHEVIDIVMPNITGKTSKKKDIEGYHAYSIELKRKNGQYRVHLTYDVETFGRELKFGGKITSNIAAGIDVNIDKVAVSVVSKQGNLLAHQTFYCHEMEYVSSNKRNNISGEVAKEIIDYILSWNAGSIVLEDITLRQDHDTNKKFNRLTHSFAKNKLQKTIKSRGLRNGFQIKEVNPAYTSVIGRFKYSKRYGMSVHEAASFVIARRGLGLDEKIPKELLQQIRKLVKPHLIKILGSMEESEKASKYGKQRRKRLGFYLISIDEFKQNHHWKLWNVVHKTLKYKNWELQLKEV
ncbi:IS200/IS605 family accessory protein TnpB-related protein [Oceanobacillus halophilus]|uniref:IS200/IS605 family accessory protein TnpB-related protein n=1 Tax=Oceanobacillus halophilus TaxID=930130 RepID=UPI001F4E1A7B|nr:IS200/IS605 family accessory protein TnpB-related protein [Oceanobacillus halophilus]